MSQLSVEERNKLAKIGSRVSFQTGLRYPELERIQHTGKIVEYLNGIWEAKSDQTGECWALKATEDDWCLLNEKRNKVKTLY